MPANDVAADRDRMLDELEYWRAVLAELEQLNSVPSDAAGELVKCSGPLLELAFYEERAGELALEVSQQVQRTMRVLGRSAAPLSALLELVDGRRRMIAAQWNERYPEHPIDARLNPREGNE
jgi:hypothetical protein